MDRIWVDGCFDFFHHGHAGALHQARALGDALVVGVHSDEAILANKGPVVMHLDERCYAVESCRWTSEVVPNAPYVTEAAVMDAHNCWYVAHGDDITTDADGNDCYAAAKRAGRFKEFRRTPNISTTDLIQRMLSKSCAHHLKPDSQWFDLPGCVEQFNTYATAANARDRHAAVFNCTSKGVDKLVIGSEEPGAPAIYTSGAFDLFHCGDIEFLAKVRFKAGLGTRVVVGVYADEDVQSVKGDNYPIMNVYERALCVLQCKHVDAVVLNARRDFDISTLGFTVRRVPENDRVELTAFKHLTTDVIIQRVLSNRAQYEARQKRKLEKSVGEETLKENEKPY